MQQPIAKTFSRICITGGTGSLGHALATFLLANTDATICIYSRDEFKQLLMRQRFGEERIRYFIGDIRDLARLKLAFHGVDLVIHTAALKYVDTSENNPSEVIATNISGTQNAIDACRECGVQRAVFISSDKGCSPTTLYGSTKLTGERLWSRANVYSPHGTEYVSVRYANVAGSRGSVIPIWREQLACNEPLSITSPLMTRFWYNLDEAVAIAWFAACYGLRGSVLVPHTSAYLITDLAMAMGGKDVATRIIGLRQAEKVHETLMTDDEIASASMYSHDYSGAISYYCIPPFAPSWPVAASHFACVHPPARGIEMYRSDVWPWRLGVEDLRAKLKKLGE